MLCLYFPYCPSPECEGDPKEDDWDRSDEVPQERPRRFKSSFREGLAIEATSFQLCSGGVCGKVSEKDFGMIFEYFAKKLFSYDDKEGLKKLRANYKAFLNGLILFPLNIPRTAYYACMQIINETVRLANIAPMILRRVTKDVELKAIAYGFDSKGGEKNILVFDLGGGT
ncbi:Cytochrome P450 87A3 [Camellia lanceoleosa]|uniref:Cytochrome P450 87A3 n=1 Tax=Camellia lanceoleosa TaxID=1840588 RepID=A0ACC0IC03_9ERIC|nr:Cytochrome P450 87A3 [Camellia lanceoleosa]